MASIRLSDWDLFRIVRMFDPEQGVVTSEATSGLVHGFICVVPLDLSQSPWNVAAVYAEDGRLWLQIDQQRWDLNLVTLSNHLTQDGYRTLTISENETLLHEVTYLSKIMDPINQSDPSFDALDEELQDLFLFLARMSPDQEWRDSSLKNWQEGFYDDK